MDILICLDHDFVMPCGVMLYSLCKNNEDTIFCIYVLTDESLTLQDRLDLEDTIKMVRSENSILFKLVTNETIAKMSKRLYSKYYPKQVLYRLLVSSLLPNDLNKVLYLDGDIIIRGSLKELWNINMENHSVGVTLDGCSGLLQFYNRIKIPMSLGYFNSGVMVINLEYWRKNLLQTKIERYIEEGGSVFLPDQDPLNVVCKDDKLHIPIKYNLQSSFLVDFKYAQFSIYEYKEELDEARVNPIILHYSGKYNRPWETGCIHPYGQEFLKYQKQTKWANVPLKKRKKEKMSIKDKIFVSIRIALTPFGLAHYVKNEYDKTLKLKQ